MSSDAGARNPRQRRFVAALLVGTALSAFTPSSAGAAPAVADISRYCTACWRNARLQPDAWPDCTQDVLTRLVERVEPERWQNLLTPETEERREFLRAIDAVKKRTQRAHRPAPLTTDVADERGTQPFEEERQLVLQAAYEHLSPRQARIMSLSLDGWSVAEIANELDLSPIRVSDEKYKAIRKLQQQI